MKALILDGALPGDATMPAIAQHLQQALSASGWSVEVVALREQRIAYCLGCFDCWAKSPGLCKIDDDGRTVTAAMLASNLVVYLTPLTFGGYSSELKKALDRSICLVSPFFKRINGEVHHKARYDRYPAVLGVGVAAAYNTAQAAIFARLVERNALNLHASAHGAFIVRADDPAPTIDQALRRALAQLEIHTGVMA
ncbi:MAG: flavodoxin family protein [Caldilinea sp.]